MASDAEFRARPVWGFVAGALVALLVVSALNFPFSVFAFILGIPLAVFVAAPIVWSLYTYLQHNNLLLRWFVPVLAILAGGLLPATPVFLMNVGPPSCGPLRARCDFEGLKSLHVGGRDLVVGGRITYDGWKSIGRRTALHFVAGAAGGLTAYVIAVGLPRRKQRRRAAEQT